ncbi:MAG: hypothetical protein P8J45_01250 [Phycisphaerales bacterium]|nr:hypothetical protein [Phycisphaerales bacterium]
MNHAAINGAQSRPVSLGSLFVLLWFIAMLTFFVGIVILFMNMIDSLTTEMNGLPTWWIISSFISQISLYLGLMVIVTMGLLLRNGFCAVLQERIAERTSGF